MASVTTPDFVTQVGLGDCANFRRDTQSRGELMKRSLWVLFALGALSRPVWAAFDPPPVFTDAPSQELQPPPADKAQIVFLEPVNKVQGYFPVGIYELKGDARTLLAITGAQTRTVLLVDPGPHGILPLVAQPAQ